MPEAAIYKDIAERTGGDIYIGVVGPVRTGKSTFIKRFMNALVLPGIENEYDRTRTRDEMPQSAAGRTIMTTEPKFIPDDAVEITVAGNTHLRVKMVDCVGYLIPGALGNTEDGEVRMVSTPWDAEPVPFAEAAEAGTRRVITEHSTIGILVTTDGSFGELDRSAYADAEARVADELSRMGKPFAIILNSAEPEGEASAALAAELETKYSAPVALVSCLSMTPNDIMHILELVLYEFPIKEIDIDTPSWLHALDASHPLRRSIMSAVRGAAEGITRIGECERALEPLSDCEYVSGVRHKKNDLGRGVAYASLEIPDAVYYKTIGSMTGFDIRDEEELIRLLTELSQMKREYDKFAEAITEVRDKGYGIVMPEAEDLTLAEPSIVRQQGGYGVRLKATAPSIHLIRANIETEINPIVGTEAQSEEMLRYLMREFEDDSSSIWESNMFGKTLYELVGDGLRAKMEHMSDDARAKLSDTLGRIINEGSGGLICIIL